MASVLFCRLININILLLFLKIVLRYKGEMKDKRPILDAIYIHAPF